MYEKCERHQVVRVMTKMKRRREDYLDVDVSSLKNKVGLLVLTSRGGGTGEAEGAPFPGFGRSVNPISIKGGGADYGLHVTTRPPDFQTCHHSCLSYKCVLSEDDIFSHPSGTTK